ncbi:hypothetical protein [Bradyrhizobium retamae]|uniref:hypothetical protein n=1 Tax=Bradyrhizobium retamae TaxID=1300035 RepID=UPI000ADCFE2F|nr:hypothetical protein [Bradyrhizobium retamae]
MSGIMSWFSTANWAEIMGAAAAFMLFFDRLAKLTPTESDNAIVAMLQKVFAVLGVKVPDVK